MKKHMQVHISGAPIRSALFAFSMLVLSLSQPVSLLKQHPWTWQ